MQNDNALIGKSLTVCCLPSVAIKIFTNLFSFACSLLILAELEKVA